MRLADERSHFKKGRGGATAMAPSATLNDKVAKKVLTETLAVKKGEAVTVEVWNNGLDFARSVVSEARSMGCTALTVIEDESAYIDSLSKSPKEVIGAMGRNELGLLERTDAYVFVPGPLLGAYQRKVQPKLVSESLRYNESWYQAANKARIRGARLTFGYVGEDMARELGRTVGEVVEKQLRAALVDYTAISRSGESVAGHLREGAHASLEAGESDLSFTLKGEPSVENGVVSRADVDAGENMAYVPPGFVTAEIEPSSASGSVEIGRTMTRLGLVEDATLEFRDGVLAKWSSVASRKKLEELVRGTPQERRRMTLMNVGLNQKMGYLYGQDRMVAGAVTLGGFGLLGVVRNAKLTVSGRGVVDRGRLQSS